MYYCLLFCIFCSLTTKNVENMEVENVPYKLEEEKR